MKVATRVIILSLFMTPLSWGKNLLLSKESNPRVEKCLQEILTSELIKDRFPNLLTNHYENSGYNFLVESDKYCACQAKNMEFEYDLKKKDLFAYKFRDRSPGHAIMDQCSLKHFSKYNLGLYFEMMVSTRIRNNLENKLQGRMIAGVKHFASQGSVRNRLLCLETKILKTCTKIQSILTTYKCVQSHLSNSKEMEVIDKQCPNFKSYEEDKFEEMGDII